MGRVKRLKEISLLALYTDIVSSLRPTSFESEDETPSSAENKIKRDPDEVVSDLKLKLNKYLVGKTRHFREKLWEECNNQFLRVIVNGKHPNDLCDFLSCVLDDKFHHLEVCSSLIRSEAPSREGKFYPVHLIETIAQNSPSLPSLHFKTRLWKSPSRASQELFAKAFLSLKNLTRLNINWRSTGDFSAFFNHIGRSCPNLTSLQLGEHTESWSYSLDQLLGLVLGEEADMLPYSVRQEAEGEAPNLHRLQFTEDSVTPICRTLKVLKIHYSRDNDVPVKIQISTTAFLLRHFPQLMYVDVKFRPFVGDGAPCCSSAIQLLHETLLELNSGDCVVQETSMAQRVGQQQDKLRSLKWITNSPPKVLNLQKLKFASGTVNLCNKIMLNAVLLMCPKLQYVRFDENDNSAGAVLSPHEVTSILFNKLKMVRAVRFDHSSTEYRRAVIASLGGQLLSVKYKYCSGLDWAEMVSCNRLQELEIESCTDDKPTSSMPINAKTFLPRLRKFIIDVCLGEWSRLFETSRPTMKDLSINCVHFGIAGASDKNWDDVPCLWPKLEELRLWYPSKSLTYDKMCQVIPQMASLSYVRLPYGTLRSEEEEEASNDFEDQLKRRSTPIELDFAEDGYGCCHDYERAEEADAGDGEKIEDQE